ncbi:MAG: MBL fold metallo-hydrolase, partial [Pseudomonadota bacterium]
MLARIGAVEVWRVLESEGPLMPVARFFPDLAPQDLARLRPGLPPGSVADDPATGEPWVVLPVQAFLLRTPRALILVDACVGNRKTVVHIPQWNDRRDGRFLAGLAAAGARPEDVDVVLCTHLHVDHAGWTTRRVDGRWVPTFPNARVLASAEDLAHARAQAEAQPDATAGALWRETLAPLLEAGRLDARPLARMAEDLDRIAREVSISTWDRESCACATLYEGLQGDKAGFELS